MADLLSGINNAIHYARTLKQAARLAFDVPKILPIGRTSPAMLLEKLAEKHPLSTGLLYQDTAYNWRQIDEQANRFAHAFAREGIRPADVVALMMDNRPEYLFTVMGLNKIGAVPALINTNVSGKALLHAVSVCGAKIMVAGGEHLTTVLDAITLEAGQPALPVYALFEDEAKTPNAKRLNDLVAVAPSYPPVRAHSPKASDTFCYIYTSGTTGLPKAAIVTIQRLLGAGYLFGRIMHDAVEGDVIYVPLPLYHTNAMGLGWGAALATGSAIALRRKFSASNFWKDVRDYRATSFVYIGELCRFLLNTPVQPGERNHHLKAAVGNGLRPDIWTKFQQRFGIPIIREFYGSTEGSAAAINFEGRPGMIGRAAPGQFVVRCDATTGEIARDTQGHAIRVKHGETGLLIGRISPLIDFKGYVDKDATSKKILTNVFKNGDRFFNSGDLVQYHKGRWMSFVDRLGDTFRWKGENVSTTEVAEAVNAAPGVLHSSVYGVQVPRADGRAGMAALDVSADFQIDAFAKHVKSQLAPYQRPRFVRLLDGNMRMTGTFKHQKEDYRKEGFDPQKTADPLYVFLNDRYVKLDPALFSRIESGETDVV